MGKIIPHNKLTIEAINSKKPETSRLTAIRFGDVVVSKAGNKRQYVICKCQCGNEVSINLNKITNGHTRSCGCSFRGLQKGVGVKYTVVNYHIRASYSGMMTRCYKKNNKSYAAYGGKGVIVCEEWRNSYQAFLDWSLANGWQRGLQIDKDIKGNGFLYSPETCCWVTKRDNCNYRTTSVKYEFEGELLTIPQICRKKGYDYRLIRSRIDHGKPLEEALARPRMKNRTVVSDNQVGILILNPTEK